MRSSGSSGGGRTARPGAPTPVRDASLRGVLRQLAAVLPGLRISDQLAASPPLEAARMPEDPPRLVSATCLEDSSLRARPVLPGDSTPFAAFLDGAQQSRAPAYAPRGVPIVLGTVGAVIRVRNDRRMATWLHEVATRLYLPVRLVPPPWRAALDQVGTEIVDTGEHTGSDAERNEHPFALADAAIQRVLEDRDRAERRLAEAWCEEAMGSLFIDGGISGSERVAASDGVVGVVKAHRTLYAQGAALDVVLGLSAWERTSVFEITSPSRAPVASWYLRLRDPSDYDPMWALVRIEVAHRPGLSRQELTARADDVSRQVLAEVTPVALPDARWDRMVYGIRDCEEFLRSVMHGPSPDR